MLSGNAHTLRQKARLAVSLAWVAGFVDAIGFILIGSFTSNMSGNTALVGARLAGGMWGNAKFCAFLVAMFAIGATFSGLLTETGRRRGIQSIYAMALGVEVIVLAAFVALAQWGSSHFLILAGLPAFAMGLQNATITQIAGSVVRTTHVTGVLTDFGIELVQLAYWFRDRTRGRLWHRLRRAFYLSARHTSVERLLLLVSIWGSFTMGALLGALSYRYVGVVGLLAPIAFLLFMVTLDLLRPIARITSVNHTLHDDELPRFGIDPGVLPKTVSVLRVQGRRGNGSRVPDLSRLAERVPRRTRVLMLILSVGLDCPENTLVGLQSSVRALRARRRELVLCTADSQLFLQIREGDLGTELGEANLCSDPEFAVARAVELASR
jgi:uncharacterized membrane protein YoaK (UPF0700 family)